MGEAAEIPVQLVEEIRSKALHAPRPRILTSAQRDALFEQITSLLRAQNAVLITHYYVDEQLQILTDATGGYVGDSLGMADYGNRHPATMLVVIGVMLDIASDHAGGRLVSVLEGGYALAGLGSAVDAHVNRMLRDNDR